MLQAWIVSPRESFYFAAQATPCSLAELHRHVRKMQRRWREGVHLSLMLGDSDVGVGVAALSAFLQRVASGGRLRDAPGCAQVERDARATRQRGLEHPSRGGALGRAWGSFGRAANHCMRARAP